jgi:Dolichyl-phosphate-mannose-protein mannosyltransferase
MGILGLVLLFVLLRWNNYDAPLLRDEGEYAYAAQLLLHGGVPYEQSFLQKPPMIAYTYALASLLAPKIFWAPRILAGVFAAFATVLLGWIARREFGPRVAMPAMWLMTPMILLPHLDQFIANTEMFMLLPLMATIAVYVGSQGSRRRPAHWLAAGFLAGITICYKYTSLPLLAFVFVAWTSEEWQVGVGLSAIARRWLCALTGGTLAGACALAPFLLHDGGRRLWECTVVFNRFYTLISGFGPAELWQKLIEFWGPWKLLFLAPCLLFLKPSRRVWFWVGLFLVAWLATAGSPYGQYYIAVMPFWALLVAVGICSFVEWSTPGFPQSQNWLRLGLAAIFVSAACWPDVPWLIRSRSQFAADKFGLWSPFVESPLLAEHLAQITRGQDSVYVAGSEPQILCYAHRSGATRFDIAYPLMIPTPLATGYQTEAMRDLQANPPAAIVFVQSPTSWLFQPGSSPEFLIFLRKFMAEKYQDVGGCFFDGSQARWLEPPLGTNEITQCSLLLYQRKNL